MRNDDVRTFNSEAHRSTVEKMRERGEKAHDEGEKIFKETGKLDQNVNIFGASRESRNAFAKNPDGTCTLVNGIKLPVISDTDGTGSMGENVAKALYAMGNLYSLLNRFDRYQIDLSVAVVQDISDKHPVVQMAQFESDNRAAEHVKKLVPDKNGDDPDEDYDLALWYVDNKVETDIVRYGLKGYYFMIADAKGRGSVTKEKVKRHLGHEMQASSISTKEICKQLLEQWHFFFIQVDGSDSTENWWADKIGRPRIIRINDSDLLAEVQASLVYVTETLQPSKNGLKEFLKNTETNRQLDDFQIEDIWQWLQSAKSLFGAQAKLPGYNNIPKPGDIFTNYRDVWPIGHTKTTEKIPEKTETTSQPIDWGKF